MNRVILYNSSIGAFFIGLKKYFRLVQYYDQPVGVAPFYQLHRQDNFLPFVLYLYIQVAKVRYVQRATMNK